MVGQNLSNFSQTLLLSPTLDRSNWWKVESCTWSYSNMSCTQAASGVQSEYRLTSYHMVLHETGREKCIHSFCVRKLLFKVAMVICGSLKTQCSSNITPHTQAWRSGSLVALNPAVTPAGSQASDNGWTGSRLPALVVIYLFAPLPQDEEAVTPRPLRKKVLHPHWNTNFRAELLFDHRGSEDQNLFTVPQQ